MLNSKMKERCNIDEGTSQEIQLLLAQNMDLHIQR